MQTLFNLLTKLVNKRFQIGFGIPVIEDKEREVIKGILDVMKTYGFSNKELEEKIKKLEKPIDEKS